jgi:hypothetical protein
MATRTEFDGMAISEQVNYCLNRASQFKRLARELEAKQNIRTAAEIDTEIETREDDVFGATGR